MQFILVATAIVVAVAIVICGVLVFDMELHESPWTGVAGVLLVIAGSVLLARHWFKRRVGIDVAPGIVVLLIGGTCVGLSGWTLPFFLPIPIALLVIAIGRVVSCPADKLLVVFGKMPGGAMFKVYRKATHVKRIVQDFRYLDLAPYAIDGRKITVDPENADQAALKLLDLSRTEIEAQARAILADGGDLASIGMRVVG